MYCEEWSGVARRIYGNNKKTMTEMNSNDNDSNDDNKCNNKNRVV